MAQTPIDLAILRGDWKALRTADPSLVELDVVRWLEGVLEDPDEVDPDRLIGRGRTWGLAGRRDVDQMALSWLRRGGADEARFGVVLALLSGFWSACPGPIPTERVDRLLTLADAHTLPGDGFLYGLLEALSFALTTGIEDPTQARRRVEKLAARPWPPGIDRSVASLAARALG